MKEKEFNEYLSRMKNAYFGADNERSRKQRLYHEIIDKCEEPIEIYKKMDGRKIYQYYDELTEKIIKNLEDKVDYISKDRDRIRATFCGLDWYDYKIVENNGVNSLLCYSDGGMSQFFTIYNRKLSSLLHGYGNYFDIDYDAEITNKEDFKERMKRTEIDSNSSNKCIKLYFSIDEEQIEPFFMELSEEIFPNNIECFAKVRMWKSNDQVTVRIYDEKHLDKIYDLAKKYKNNMEQGPFMPVTEEGIGMTLDNGDSYNAFLRDLFMKYFSQVDDINLKTFLTFVKEDYQKNDRQKLMYQNLFLALNSKTIEVKDLEEAAKELKSQETKEQQVFAKINKMSARINRYLNNITTSIIDMYSQYDLDDARELFMKAIHYDGDKVVYSSESGLACTKSDLINSYGDTIECLTRIEETFKKLMTFDKIYQQKYEEKGLEGIREVTSKRNEWSFKTKYGFMLDDDSCALFAKRNGFELQYNKNGNINTRKFNLDLEKAYKERQKVKIKK